jgi:hypothetical protein
MDAIERNLERYLETESLLNAFFAGFDFCVPECIAIEMQKNDHRPVAACCKARYYAECDLDHPAYRRLRLEREKRYGKPEDHIWADPVSPCEYHNPARGCLLASHKSPICLGFLCPKGIDRLRSDYGIYAYDYLGMYYALEWILTGDLPEHQYREFRAGILDMTRVLKSAFTSERRSA